MADQGGVRWNPETQSWETGDAQAAPYTPPPPPRPGHAPDPGHVPPPEPGVPPSLPPPSRPRPWFRRQAVIVSVVVAVLAAGVGGYLLWGRGEPGPADAKPRPSAVESPPDPEPSPGPSEPEPSTSSSSSSPPPEGYRAVTETEFSLVVPEAWEGRTEEGKNGVTLYYYEAPDGPERIQVFRVTEDGATPMSTLELAEKDLKRLPGYERNTLGPVADPRGEAAELDYSYESGEWDMRLRTLDRIVPGGPGDPTLWAVLSIGPADGWPRQRQVVEDVTESFARPADPLG